MPSYSTGARLTASHRLFAIIDQSVFSRENIKFWTNTIFPSSLFGLKLLFWILGHWRKWENCLSCFKKFLNSCDITKCLTWIFCWGPLDATQNIFTSSINHATHLINHRGSSRQFFHDRYQTTPVINHRGEIYVQLLMTADERVQM